MGALPLNPSRKLSFLHLPVFPERYGVPETTGGLRELSFLTGVQGTAPPPGRGAEPHTNDMRRYFDILHDAFHRRGTRVNGVVESFIWLLIVFSLTLFTIELLTDARYDEGHILYRIDRVVLWIFVIELVLRIVSVRPPEIALFDRPLSWRIRQHVTARVRHFFQPLFQIDFLSVLAIVPALRALRALRLLRVLRSVKVFKYSNPFLGILRGFRENSLLYSGVFTFLLATVALGGTSIYLAERDFNPEISSLADGLWWTIVTITTVGYGDISPVSTVGRVIASVLMVAGMFTLALFAGVVGTSLLQAFVKLRAEYFRMTNKMNHIIVCGYYDGVRMLLNELLDEVDEETDVVVFAQGQRPNSLPARFLWVDGDPTRESELSKVRLEFARAVIVIGSRRVTPQQADAESILVVFTMRSWLSRNAAYSRRKQMLHIASEILDEENVQHATSAGADEVIETTRVGFSLLARSVFSHGAARSVAEVARGAGDHFFTCANPWGEQVSYGDAYERLKNERDVVAFGILRGTDGKIELGPSDRVMVSADDCLVYLADERVAGLPMAPAAGAKDSDGASD